MPNVLGLEQHHVEVGLNLLQKIRGPQTGIAPAYNRDVGGGVGLKWGFRGAALEVIPPKGRVGRLSGVGMRMRRFHHRMLQA